MGHADSGRISGFALPDQADSALGLSPDELVSHGRPQLVEEAAGQRAGFERAAVRVPVRHRLQHRPLVWCHGRRAARPYPGQQTPLAGLGEQVGLGLAA